METHTPSTRSLIKVAYGNRSLLIVFFRGDKAMDKLRHYEIDDKLGEGKHGPAFLATDSHHQRTVVIKHLNHPTTATDEWKSQYRARLQQSDQINNPLLARSFTLEEEDGQMFVVREHIEGRSLTEVIAAGLPTPARILKIAIDLVGQLGSLHSAGLVHGNITSANIILEQDGTARLVDDGLGLAGEVWSQHPPAPTGEMICLAPELFRDEDPSIHSDHYALGSLLYLMWTGQPIFPDDDVDALKRSIAQEPVSFELHPSRAVPGIARLLISKLLAKDPDQRFASSDELLFTIQGMISLGSTPNRTPSGKSRSWSPRLYLLMSVLAALLVILWLVITSGRP